MEKTWASKPMSFWVIKGKDGIWTRAWRKSTCRISSPVPYQAGPPFQDAEKGIWTLTPEEAHAPEACVSAVPPPPHSSIIHFLGKMPRKKRNRGAYWWLLFLLSIDHFNAAGYRLSCSLEVSLRIKMAHKRAKMQTTNPGMPPSGPNSPPVIKVWFEVVKYIKDDSLSKPLTWKP